MCFNHIWQTRLDFLPFVWFGLVFRTKDESQHCFLTGVYEVWLSEGLCYCNGTEIHVTKEVCMIYKVLSLSVAVYGRRENTLNPKINVWHSIAPKLQGIRLLVDKLQTSQNVLHRISRVAVSLFKRSIQYFAYYTNKKVAKTLEEMYPLPCFYHGMLLKFTSKNCKEPP